MTASDYVDQYHKIVVPEFELTGGNGNLYGTKLVATPVTEYSNSKYTSFYGISYANRVKFKDKLLGFFKKRAEDVNSGITSSGDGYSLTCSKVPVYGLSKVSFQSAIAGKISASSMKNVIQFLSYWRSYRVLIDKASEDPLPNLVSMFYGMDCNGFVGHYLKAKFPTLDVNPNNPEETYYTKSGWNGGVRRAGPMELREDDIIIFDGHIAMISEVIISDSKEALCRISESRTHKKAYGGPQTNALWVKLSSKGKWSISNHERIVSGIVRIPGM